MRRTIGLLLLLTVCICFVSCKADKAPDGVAQAKEEFDIEIVEKENEEDGPGNQVTDSLSPTEESQKTVEDANKKIAKTNNPVGSASLDIVVPRVTGLSENEAKTKLENCGFAVEILKIKNDNVPEGIVFAVDPAEGTRYPHGKTVKIMISKGDDMTVTVPDVIGKDIETARKELTSKGFTVSEKLESSGKPEGTVLLTSPLPGVTVEKGSAIILTVSSGKNQ